MSNYLRKYVGTYRVVAEYDQSTNDFPRLEDDNIDPSYDDVFIVCSHGNLIYHFGYSTLCAYIPSITRGRNIIRKLEEENLKDIIFDIEESDNEVLFKFKAGDIDKIAELLKAKVSGAKINPFSVRNLPKRKYEIPPSNLLPYKEITSQIDKSDLLMLSHICNRFLDKIVPKKYKGLNVRADMRLKCLKGKEYIHSIGLWEEYIKYLKKWLEDEYGRKES